MSGLLEQLAARLEHLERELARRNSAPISDGGHVWQTVEAYAEKRSIAESTVRAAVKSGRLPAMKYGRTGRAIRVRADVEIGMPVFVRVARIEAADEDPAAFAARALTRTPATKGRGA